VEAVEAGALDTPETETLLQQYLAPLLESGADQLALGCTHYPFLRPVIERLVGQGVAVIDPAAAVASQTRRVLIQQRLETNWDQTSHHVFCTSGDMTAFATMIERLLPSLKWNVRVCSTRWQQGHLMANGVL
jgi:glutamate racemase